MPCCVHLSKKFLQMLEKVFSEKREFVLQEFSLQIKLCYSRLVCATKTSSDSSSCNLTKTQKSLALLTAVLKLNHSLENLQLICQSKVPHLKHWERAPHLFLGCPGQESKSRIIACAQRAQEHKCKDVCTSYYHLMLLLLGHHVIIVHHASKEPAALYKCGHTDLTEDWCSVVCH